MAETSTFKINTTSSITSSVKTTSSFNQSLMFQGVEEDYEKQITQLKEEFNQQISIVKKEIFDLGTERSDLRQSNKKNLEELNEIKSKIRAATIEIEQIKQKYTRLSSDDLEKKKQQLTLEEKVNLTKERIFENEMQDSTKEEKISLQQDRIFQMQMELDDFKFEDAKNENTIRSYEAQLHLLNDEILHLKNRFAELENTIKDKEVHKSDLGAEKENSLLKISYIEKEKEELLSQLDFKMNQIENLYRKIGEINIVYEDYIKKSDIAKANIKVYEKKYNDALALKREFDSKLIISQNDLDSKKIKIENLELLSKSKDQRIIELNSQISQLEKNIQEYNAIIEKGNKQVTIIRIDIDAKIKMIEDSENENTMDDAKMEELKQYVDKQKKELEDWMEEYKRDEKEIQELEEKIKNRIQKIFDAKILLVDLNNQFNFHYSVSENLIIEDEESITKIAEEELTTEKISRYNDIIKYKSQCISNLKNHCEKLNEIIKGYKFGNSELKEKLEDMKIEKKRVIEKKQAESAACKTRRETLVSYSKKESEDIYLTKVAEIKTTQFKHCYITGAGDFENTLNQLENYVNGINLAI
jgi:chromosome segregation ATPase